MEDTENAESEAIPKSGDASPSQGKSCALCGCATPAVRCDRCNSQTFCLSCDDMYHRHPKRKLHLRKAVDSIWSTGKSPRLRRRTDLPGDPCKIPIPPPRTKKRERHTIGGRIFLKSGHELGSFGHSKVFDPKNFMPSSKDFFAGQKSPASLGETHLDDDASSQVMRPESAQLYENENVANAGANMDANVDDKSPWNTTRTNIASPIQVSIPSNSPDIVANGQSFGYPSKPHSQSAADLSVGGHHPGHPPYHHPFHGPYPYVHPAPIPPMHPYSHSMAHLNCAQCLSSSSWSNLMSPHPSPYFHPMPWGSAHNTMTRPPHAGQHLKQHSHGDLASYPDSNFHYPYPGAGYYHNGPPVVDPNFIKDLHEQAEMQKHKKDGPNAKQNPGSGGEEMEVEQPAAEAPSSEARASAPQAVQQPEEEPAPVLPSKPTEPWACVHCTFINPPGIHICQICCKTSYGNSNKGGEEQEEESGGIRPRSRDSESPLVNRDALINSPGFADFQEAQKHDQEAQMESPFPDSELRDVQMTSNVAEAVKLTTETQTSTSTKTTDVQTQNVYLKSIASSTDSIFPKQEISVQTEVESAAPNFCSVATDPMISSQSMESLLSGVSAPPYHNRRAGWGRGATSFSTQSLYERGRSRSPMPRSLSLYNEAQQQQMLASGFQSEEAMHSASQAWLYTDPMYYKPHNQGLTKEDYFDGTWGSMDRLNRRVKHKKDKGKVESMQPKFHRSLDDLKSDKRPEMLHTQELMMLQTVKEAERCGFSLEDLHVAYLHCGKEHPVYWLEDNWPAMIKNVIALAAKYGEDNEENDVGVITATEAKDALRIHRGDIWDAVTECIENRQRKILELTVRGNFTQKQISDALKHNEGNVELAYADLVRASTRRHKFILSPGLSEDSEDLNLYNPVEEGSTDHHVGHIKLVKTTDISGESKIEKKKSDFLTKLSAIRTAQSERRKAREEKELIRETITQDYEVEVAPKEKDISAPISMSREDSKEVEENIQDIPVQSPVEQEIEVELKPTTETPEVGKVVGNVKESTEDSIPIDFDTNWSESQGEWIEEYSDEQWEDDSQWVGLGKKFQKMEKEFEEEAMQMAALWEKEELEDDVFEEEAKELKTEAEVIPDSDRKFDEWVQANLKVDSFEYEEEEAKSKAPKQDITSDSLVDSIELEVGRPSPLQHYPTTHDLSMKSHFESDWVDLPADEEIEKLAHDIVCEGSDIENKFEEEEMVPYEEEKKLDKLNDLEGSDEDWEKIEVDEQQLQDVNELDQFAFPDKEGDIEKNIEELDEALMENIIGEKESELSLDTAEVKIEEDSKVLYKNLDSVAKEDTLDLTVTEEPLPEVPVSDTVEVSPRKELPLSDGDLPRPPVRRKSKLNSAAIEQALKNHAEISADIPPVLPEKTKNKDSQSNVSDLYARPDRATKVSQEQVNLISDRSVPQKPPRLNLSPELDIQKAKEEIEPAVPSKTIISKDASPVTSLSYESDSNCFADSESDTEIKLRRQKNLHRKAPKYENEIEDAEIENISKAKLDKMAFDEEKADIMLESNLDFELDDDIDPALIEPLPPMKSIDFDPELPILLGGRGRGLSDLDDVDAPKAFREDTTRPLQLFKATKRETPTNTLSMSTSGFESIQSQSSFEQQEETSFIMRTKDELPARPLELAPSRSMPVSDYLQENAAVTQDSSQFPVSSIYENQVSDKLYYNETIMPPQPEATERLPEKWEAQPLPPDQIISEVGLEKNIEQVEPSPTVEEQEMGLSEMEGISAAVDYFFGRYNEITVTRPKKKTPARAKPASPSPKPMSASEIAPSTKSEAPSEMEKSAAAVLETKDSLQSIPSSDLKASISRQDLSQKEVQAAPVASRGTSVDKVKEPAPSEYLPFAEDYLFGCYNEVVVVPRKKKTITLAPIPKLGASLTKAQNEPKEKKPPVKPDVPPEQPAQSVPEPSPEEPEEELSREEHAIPSETSSLIYDEVFHDLPADILANQSFDDGGSIYYESFQDAVEEIQDSSSMTGNVVNIRAKTVHFEEPAVPVAPPRRNKVQPGQNPKAAASAVSSESYADEYLFRQYEERSQAKKKLPVCSEDFRMKQGFEPTEFPCDTPLLPDEQQEGVISSEISVETPQKTIDSLKNNLEYDFGDSEQSLDSVKHEMFEPGTVDKVIGSEESQIDVSVVKDSSVSGGFSVEATMEVASDVRKDNMQRTDIQISDSTGSFEELSLPNQSEERALSESPAGSSGIYVTEESQIISDDLAIESSLNDIQPPRPPKPKPYDQGSYPSAPSGLEMDQFVFIEQTQDIIDDSYTLYDIQESLQSSLACDLNYVDVKNNIEDECTDDSEKEWKRNEDIKNSLNASFLSSVSSERDFDDQVEAILDISEKFSLEENKDQYLEAEKSKKEELNLDEEESKIFMDKNYFEGVESQSDVTEACTSEQSDYIVIDSQMGETLDNQLSAEISQNVKAIECDYESKDSFSVDENLKESEFAKPESLEMVTTTEDRDECSSEISHETVESTTQPLPVLHQAASEISDTSDSAVISEDLSITQEDTLEFSEEVIHKTDEEEVSVTEDQQIDILEDLEASGELSDNGNDLSDDSLAPSTHSSVSTQIAVSMKLGLKEPEPDESSLFEFSENLENDNEVSGVVSLPSSTIAEKVSSGEEAFPLEHISESGDAEIPEFTQTVSTTDNVTKEEYESEIKELEYGENIEMDIEQAMAEGDKFTPTPPLESESFTNLEICSPEMDLDLSDSAVSQSVEEGLEISKKEPDLIHEKSFKSLTMEDSLTESTGKIATEFDSEEILQDSDAENMDKIVAQPSGYSGIYDVYEIKDDIQFISEDTVDKVIDVSSSVSDYSQMKEAETDQGFGHSESILSDDMQLSNTEVKLSKPDSVETTTDSLYDEENIEEPSLSIMSHFCDEWYHNVEPSTQFTLLSTDSIYAKYGAAESSESGNESGDDNVVCFKPPEDIMQEDKVPTTENLEDQIAFKDQDVNIISMDSSDVEKDSFMDEVQLQNITDKSDFENISNQTELLPERYKESQQEWVKDQEISEERKGINDFMSYDTELTETVTFISENEESIPSEEQSTSETKLVESKFSTSKSCQTEDSFEEDIFFDSFDDTFTIPSYIHLPIEVQTKPEMSDMSIQCEIISTEAITAKVTSIVTEIQATAVVSEATETQDFPEHPKLSEEIVKEPSDESSCESFEESDSDFFIESPSSHDELEVPSGKKGFLYTEIDSDTGFSSGSDSGWIQGREKHLKGKKTPGTDVQLQEISSTRMSVGKELAGSVQTYIVSQEKSIVKSQVAETLTISEKSVISESDKGEQESEDSEVKVCPFPPEIIERAVTPVAVPQFPSFEEDLVFVEMEEHIEEASEGAREEVVSTTPTVEYFYGALPETVKIESPPDRNEQFFETASELSESLSFPLDSTESFSDSSVAFSEKIPKVVNVPNKETEMLEEESFADTCSSFRVEDSISEYYALPESITSKSESENLILTKTESSEVQSDKVLADFTKVMCDKDMKTEDVQVDNTSQVTKSLDVAENKDVVSKNLDAAVISSESELGTEMMDNILSKKEILSEEVTVFAESQETAGEENVEIADVKVPVDSGLSVCVDGSKSQAPASDVGHLEYEAVEPIKPSADVPPVPSDIVRYLYYDDSITFDDDSYHTQSEILEVPSLPADEPQAIAHAGDPCETAVAKDSEILQDVVLLEKLTDKVCSTPMKPEKQLEDNLISESTQEFVSKEADFQESPELQKMPEESVPEEVCIPPVSELKLATVEIISAEDVSELSSGQIAESVQNIVSVHEKVSEPEVLSLDTESEDFQPIELKKTSPEVPQVPSDIVRYLYYGDDITFEEATDVTFDDTSFHSQSDALGLPSEDKMTHSDRDVPEISDLDVASADNLEFMEELESSGAKLSELSEDNKVKLLPEMKKDSFEDSSYKHESSSGGELSLPPLDSSECVEKWFDIEADPSINGKKERPIDSEQHSSTKSSALKDSEQPCIPEYILSPIPEGNLPATKTDIDEVTDISTHFTMTDDSDKFSDIESDTSLNFEEECILPLEIEPVEIENAVLFESSIDEEDDDMNLPTPEVKCLPGGFQFPTPELSEEFLQKSVEPNEPQEEFDECATSTEFSEQHREQFAECLTSSEVLGQQPSEEADSSRVAIEFADNEPKELFESCVSYDVSEMKEHFTEPLTSSEQLSKEGMFYDVQDHTDQEFKEFHECDNLNDISEISKEQFSECLTASEEQGKESASHEVLLNQELMEKMDEQFSSVDVSEHFTECELISGEAEYEVSQESVSEQSKELSYDYAFTDLRDENGNIPESLSTVPDVPVSSTKMVITAELDEQFEITETELSCYTSPIEETKAESSFPVIEADTVPVCTKDSLESSQIKEPEQTSLDKDEDIDESCYTAPNEDSVGNEEDSISTEMTDNWVDAEGKNIEVDKSIYDLPLEEMNLIQPEVSTQETVNLSEESYFAKSFESISYKEKAVESIKSDLVLSEVEKMDASKIETFILPSVDETKSDITAKTEEISDKFVSLSEDENVIPIAKDTCEISEEASLKMDEHLIAQSEFKEKPDDSINFAQVFSSEKCFETSSDVQEDLLSSDVKGFQEVKLESESEMKTAVQKEVNIECGSAVSGAEPKFLLGETVYDTQEVGTEEGSSKELCSDEKVITSSSSVAAERKDSLEIPDAVNKEDTQVTELQVIPEKESITTDTYKEKEPELVTLTTKSETAELLEVSDDFSAECIAAVTSESAVFENISPAIKKVVYEEPHTQEVLKVELKEISIETETESLEKSCDVDTKNLVDDTDIQIRKPETSDELETALFKGEVLVDSCKEETALVLKESVEIVDKETDVDVDKTPQVFDVDSQISKPETSDKLETYSFKGEFSVDTCEKETEFVLKKSDDVLDKRTFIDTDKKSLIIDMGSQLSKPETSGELETYNFKGEFSVGTCEKEPAVGIKERIDTATDKDFTSKISDFKMESSVEVVDFKMISNGLDFKDQIQTNEERISGFIEQPSKNYAQGFDAKTKDISFKIIESTETVDFKGLDVNVDSEKLEIIEFSRIGREDAETKFTTDDTCLVSNNQIISSESVDFKGTLGGISTPTEIKEEKTSFARHDTYKMPSTTQEQNLKAEATDNLPEIVDFRGQIVSSELDIKMGKEDVLSESANYSKSTEIKDKLSVSEDSNIGLEIGDSKNIVDFKIIGSDELSVRKTEVRDTTVFTDVKDLFKVEETVETVDFKQFISVGDQSSTEKEATFIQKDIHPVKDTDLLNYETSEEIAEFRGSVSSGVKALESHSDVSKEVIDTSQLLHKDKTIVMDTLNETHEEITFESHGNVYHEENVITYSVSNETSVAESGELYSCVETLSAADTSMQFYSLSDDVDDTLNTTSEDFTDVPSHFTSTEDSDKWSDVEGDLSMEDVEFDRDKTPTRTDVKSNVLREITETGNIELQTPFQDKTTKPDSTLEEVYLESYEVNKSIQKQALDKYEEVVDSKDSGKEEIFEKWSDVESEMHLEDRKVNFKASNIYDQSVNLDMEQKGDMGSETPKESTVEEPLMEHFAAIKSLNESLTLANTFSSFDADTAVSKTHEDSTDISSQFEKTESECWLEVATDNSVSEFSEDAAFSSETEEKLVTSSDKVIEDKVETSISCQFDSEMRRTSTMSTSSSYTDLDNSDQTSDTCADISLQGATTESSDRWSDIEAEALIDDVLYGKTDLIENVESADFVQSIKKLEERKEKDESPLLESQPIMLSSVKSTEVCASSTANVTSKSEPLVKDSPERKPEALKVTSLSFEGPDSLSANLTDSGPSFIPTETSVSFPSNVTTTVMSDDDFTNVTPLDATTEESDKWSDISGDESIEEIEEDSSVSLKASLKLQESESSAISSEFKVDVSIKEPDSLSVEEKKVLNLRLSDTDSAVKETVLCESISEKKEILFDLQKQQDVVKAQEEESVTFNLAETAISQPFTKEVKVADTQSSEMECISDYSLKKESMSEKELTNVEEVIQTDVSVKLKSEEVVIDNSQLRQHIETEDISESKITDESETVDTFTDVLTHTLSPETSEAYCELESDHSVEDFETQPEGSIETPSPIQHIVDTSRQTVPEYYENSLTVDEMAVEAEEYELDAILENELENYEEEEYSLSEHFEINEDELIYPLPYNDWIEQSFELKEYGIEAAFSETGSDIHGLGIASDIHGLGIADEEYDDEDIQRAIDFNISNFEDEGGNNIETVVTTESFKTLSNDVSPHLKHSDKEFDSWSTADAPSIEEEEEDLAEHDNILSKIDELLAEDFDLGEYQTESPLQHEQDTKDYFFKDISTPEYLHSEDYAEIKESSLPEETLSHIDKESEQTLNSRIISSEELLKKDSKIPDSVTFEKDDKIIKTESVPSEVILKKDSKISKPEYISEEANLKKDSKISESESVSSKFSIKKDSKLSESESVSIQFSPKKDSEISESEISTQFSVKRDFKKSEPEAASSQFSLKKDYKISESEDVSIQFSVKKDSEISESGAPSSQFTLKKDSKTADSETVVAKISQRKDSTALESKSLASEIALKKDSELYEPKAEAISSQFSLKKDSKTSDPETVVAKIRQIRDSKSLESKVATSETTLKKDSELSESETVTSKLTLKKDSIVCEQESVSNQMVLQKDIKISDTETVSSKLSLMKDSKISEPETVSSKVTLDKDSKTFHTEAESSKISLRQDSKVPELESVSGEITLAKDSKTSETISGKISLQSDSKVTESEKISVKETVTTSIEEVENGAVVCEKISKSKIKASLSSSDESSHLLSSKRETTQVVSSSEADTSLLLSSTESKMKQETTQAVSAKVVQSADAETEVSVKLKTGVESAVVDRGKDFTLTTDEASASITLFSKDSQIKDQSAGSITIPATETDSSFDIPSKQLSKSSTASAAECSIRETSKKLSEKTETFQSSQLSDSSKLMLTSDSNIPEPKVQDNLSEKSVSETLTIISKEQVSTDSVASEVKPDIPRKVKRRSLDTREVLQAENVEKKPSLPPKLSKRHSTSSSSPSESLSSSSSMESVGSFESAPSGRSRKSSLKSSEDTSYHSESPEVPARRSRSSKLSSSSRSRSRDSEDSSLSSSLRIRRRSSNFRDTEPIDLSKKRASIDERMQKLQNEGKCQTREKAFIAAKLIEMQFEEEDALLASRQCNTVYNAVKFLTQLCELCNCRFPINLMTSMVQCTHRACKECLKAHFTSLIYDRSIFTLLCPVCRKPDITDQNIQEYFNHLDIMLRNILETKVYDLFQRKLRDEVLTKDPNFHWCSQCSSGFIASPRLKKLYCPDCSAITCALCHQTWELEHEGVHCERFQQWKDMHTPEPPPAGLVKFLVDRGIGCPSCGLLYAQACAGCMMYKCSHCSFEFCGFCIQPMKRGRECANDVCEMRGLHIHHVHNCLFYLRDLDISEIQMLLEEESVPYLTIPPKDQIVKSRCQVREQKHAHGIITEDRCGRDIEPYCGGLCRTHYYEYLAELLRQNGISPLSMMTIQDLQSMLRKSRVLVPERMKGETSEDYYERLLKLITSTLT